MSVTYGAGGNTRKNTVAIAKGIQDTTGVTTIAHLTCVGATKENIHNTLDEMKAAGIENVLALRGDRPRDFEGDPFVDFHYFLIPLSSIWCVLSHPCYTADVCLLMMLCSLPATACLSSSFIVSIAWILLHEKKIFSMV